VWHCLDVAEDCLSDLISFEMCHSDLVLPGTGSVMTAGVRAGGSRVTLDCGIVYSSSARSSSPYSRLPVFTPPDLTPKPYQPSYIDRVLVMLLHVRTVSCGQSIVTSLRWPVIQSAIQRKPLNGRRLSLVSKSLARGRLRPCRYLLSSQCP